jgi:exodeoxyribonuclease VII large subunit
MTDPNAKMYAALFAENTVLSVSELNEQIKELLEAEFFALNVQGEISNYKRHTSGHWYFTLKDAHSQLRAVFFRQWNRLLRFEPENGLEVRARGRLSVYEPRGEYQINIETLEPVGVGVLQLAFEQQVKRLAAEGLFDEARKRKLPAFPRRIAIVTSPVGAALRDMLQILERRNPLINVLIAPVRVQGNGAAGEIADALKALNKFSKQQAQPFDAIIVGRGGGSAEDLWAFNEEAVARAIFASDIPVISAVGHETDITIADLVADLRASTPSAAAELVSVEASALIERLSSLEEALHRALAYDLLRRKERVRTLINSPGFTATAQAIVKLAARRRELETRAVAGLQATLQKSRWRLYDAERRLAATDFRAPLLEKRARLAALENRMSVAVQKIFVGRFHALALTASKLDVLSPLAVLGRGYTLVRDDAGKLVTHAKHLQKAQRLSLRFQDGEAGCQVL